MCPWGLHLCKRNVTVEPKNNWKLKTKCTLQSIAIRSFHRVTLREEEFKRGSVEPMKPASSAHQSRPGTTGGIPEPCPSQMTACAFPSEDCALKKFTGSGLLECKSRPKTRKLVLIVLEFASKNCFFVVFVNSHRISWNFGDEDLFIIIIFGLHLKIRGTSQNDYENLWTFLNQRSFFFNPHFRICGK